MARNFSCGSSPVTLAPECAGNGDCVYSDVFQRGVCQCYPGFRGNSDFLATNSLVDCHISNTAIITLWSIVLAFVSMLSLLVGYNIKKILRYHSIQNARLERAGKAKSSLLKNASFAALLPFVLLGYPSVVVIAILRIVDQENHIIGRGWIVTIFWFILRASFYFTAMRFQPALIESMLRGQRACESLLIQNRLVANVTMFLAIACMFTVLAPLLATPSDPFDFFWGRFSYVFSAVCLVFVMLISMFQARYATRKIDEVLLGSYETTKDERTLLIATELKNLQWSFIKQQIFQGIIQLFIACVPFMWSKHDYIFIITSTGTLWIGYRSISTIALIQQSAIQRPMTSGNTKPSSKRETVLAAAGPMHDESTGGTSSGL